MIAAFAKTTIKPLYAIGCVPITACKENVCPSKYLESFPSPEYTRVRGSFFTKSDPGFDSLCSCKYLYPRSYALLHDSDGRLLSPSSSFCNRVDGSISSSLDAYRVIQKPNAVTSSRGVGAPGDLVREYLLSRANTPIINRRAPRPKVFPTGGKLIKAVCKEFTRFGEELKRIPAQFEEDVRKFTAYLTDTAKIKLKIKNRYVFKNGEEVEKVHEIPYIHRWTEIYRKSILAKLYQLEKALTPSDLSNITMITLTVSQRGRDQEECLYSLMENYTKLMDVLRHRFGAIDYFYILEPHKTGYAHMHLIYMKLLSCSDKQLVINTWDNRYGAGSREGLDFSEPRASDDGQYEAGKITKVRSYIMKYLCKGLRSETMAPKELLFNALLKKTGIRLWNCSRRFSRIMKAPAKEGSDQVADFKCLSVELYDTTYDNEEDGFISQIYPRPSKHAVNVVDHLLYSVPIRFYKLFVETGTYELVKPVSGFLKFLCDRVEVYERVVSIS